MLHKQFGGYVPMAIITYCFNEGFTFPTASLALKVYFLDVVGLDGPASARHTIMIKAGWIAKPFVGMLSDFLPLCGFRRSSYIALSCAGGLVAWTCLAVWSMPAKSTLPFLALAGLSFSIPDLMVDATSAELIKKAPEQASNTQALNQMAFAVGGLLACSLSGLLVHHLGPRSAFMALNLCLLLLLAATLMRWLPEKRVPKGSRHLDVEGLRKHMGLAGLSLCMSIAALVLLTLQVFVRQRLLRFKIASAFLVLVPLGFYLSLRRTSSVLAKAALFIFLHGALQPSYPDTMFQWMKTAKDGPRFSTVVLGWTDGFGSLGLLVGVFIYTRFLTKYSYRRVFTVAILATAIPSAIDLVMVKRWNLALQIPDIAMAIGDESFQNCVLRLFRMPVAVLAMKACPKGMQGSVMSLILSLGGFGNALGVLFGSCLLEWLGVRRGHYERFPEALAVRGLCRLLPLLVLPFLIPAGLSPSDPVCVDQEHDIEEGNEENNDGSASSPEAHLSSTLSDGGNAAPATALPSTEAFKHCASVGLDGSPSFARRVSVGSDSTFAGALMEDAGTNGFNRLVSASSMGPSEPDAPHDGFTRLVSASSVGPSEPDAPHDGFNRLVSASSMEPLELDASLNAEESAEDSAATGVTLSNGLAERNGTEDADGLHRV